MKSDARVSPPRPLLRAWLASLGLFVGCIFIYRQSLGFGFLMFDDDINFLFNREFGALDWNRLRWIATEHAVMLRYVPVGWLAYCGIASIEGLDPFWFHLASVGLHAAACVVLYFVLARVSRLLANPKTPASTARGLGLIPFALAAGWGWHPLRVGSVAWVTTLIYLLATLLGLLSLQALLISLEEARFARTRRALSCLLFVAALLSHPAAIAFLPIMAACAAVALLAHPDRASRANFKIWPRMGNVLWPFAAAAGLSLAVTLWVRQLGSAVSQAATPTLAEFGPIQRIAQASAVLVHFIQKTAWPASLSPAYPLVEVVNPSAPLFLLSMIACAGLVVLCVLLLRRHTLVGVFALSSLAAVAPFLGLQEHPFFPSDRYTYIPTLGVVLTLLAAVHASRLVRKITLGVLPAVIGIVLPVLALQSMRQLTLWSSDDSLFKGIAAIQVLPASRDFYYARLVRIHLNRGEFKAARLQLEQMRSGESSSISRPELAGEITRAENGGRASAVAQLLLMQARYAAGRGDTRQTIDRLRRAVDVSPRYAEARFSLGMVLAGTGDARKALSQLLWLRENGAAIPAPALRSLRQNVAAAFRGQGEERLARLTENLAEPAHPPG